ncbi:TetR/AcrR family transcriptional regulator [Ruminococcaceae bacterium OttesenSCG-928-D13]|nr:TetR/AcrR family transcriptional regulator [Ruminococcaceae bacterium OttesenSCG-928-D13]
MNSSDTEKRILEAAMDVVSEHSISKTRMRLIAQKAGMAQSNVHYYFKTKRDLLLALLEKMQQDNRKLRHSLVDSRPDTLRDKLAGFYAQRKDLIENRPGYEHTQIDFWSQRQNDPEVGRLFAAGYTEWRDHICREIGRYLPRVEANRLNLVAAVIMSQMMGASLQCLNNPGIFDLDAYFELCLKTTLELLPEAPGAE